MEGINWLAPGDESVVKTVMLDDATAARRAALPWARETQAKARSGDLMWTTDGSHIEDTRAGAAALCTHRYVLRSCHSYLGTGQMKVFKAKI